MPQLNVDATSPARLVDDQDRTVILRGVNINSSFSRFIYQYGPVFNTGAF